MCNLFYGLGSKPIDLAAAIAWGNSDLLKAAPIEMGCTHEGHHNARPLFNGSFEQSCSLSEYKVELNLEAH